MLKRPGEYGEPPSKRVWSRSEARIWTITLFVGTCMLYAARIALPICAAVIGKEYGWNKTDSGTVLSCFFWGYAVTQVLAGGIADKIGGEKILPHSTVCWALLTFFTPQLFDFAYYSGFPLFTLLLVRICTGITQAFHVPSMASMVGRHLTAGDKGKVFGVILAGSHCGTVLAGSLGSIILDSVGWRSVFQVFGLLALLWTCWLRYFVSKYGLRSGSGGHSADDEEELIKKELVSSLHVNPVNPPVPWMVLFRHPAFWAAVVAQYTGANAYFTMFNWLPSYFHETFPTAKGIVYNLVPSLAIVMTSLAAPYMAARLLSNGHSMTATRRIMEGISLIGVALCFFIVPATSTFVPALLMFTLAMAARGIHHGGVSVNPHDFAPHHTGSVFGLFNACGAITGFIGVFVAGHILEATNNNWSYVFIITALQCVLGAVVYALWGTGSKII